MKRSMLIGLLAVALVAIGLALAWRGASPQQQMPAMAVTRLDGAAQELTALRGKVVLVNFWATSCTTCVAEMPRLVETHRKFSARGYETVAIAMSYDRADYVARFAATRGLPFIVAHDRDGEAARRFGDVALTPTSLLVDRRGSIVKRFVGAPDFDALHALVEKLLAEG